MQAGGAKGDIDVFLDALTLEFIGGSRDGDVISASDAPVYIEINSANGWREIYERQTEDPPFIYEQIGYVPQEQWH